DLRTMRAHLEPVRAPDLLGPLVDVALGDLDDGTARLADQVMVMHRRAEPIARFRRVFAQDVDRPFALEEVQRTVHGGKTDLAAARAQPAVKLLRRKRVSPF